jgi:hypothetical protein
MLRSFVSAYILKSSFFHEGFRMSDFAFGLYIQAHNLRKIMIICASFKKDIYTIPTTSFVRVTLIGSTSPF